MNGPFGTLSAHHLLNWRHAIGHNIEQTVSAFLTTGEAVLSRLIQGPRGAMILSMVPGDAESGAIYVYDRQSGDMFMLSFDDIYDDRFSAEAFDLTFKMYDLFRFVDRPELLIEERELAEA
ncbi:hypothetical protein ACFPT7_07100 [Acidicapsa dinghuensis]|uniref:SMI1/KNR4 family protein n=1 Tax=Acidicapsa dinghuensis TaxID=2218256 RepID=A0ABW1ECF7_9BACT|nr:hypothetical protein [Acidicapsa dinghuensis]